jgi:SOS-response transcriptional repressor LexA
MAGKIEEFPIHIETDADLSACGGAEPFALRVMGDSMEPEFWDGCIIVIDPTGIARTGAYVLALDDSDEYIFRQLIIEDGRHSLRALNPGYDDVPIEGLDRVKGVVVQRAGTRRKHRKRYD